MKLERLINKIRESILFFNDNCEIHFNNFSHNVLICLKRNELIEDFKIFFIGKQKKIKVYFKKNIELNQNIIQNIELVSKKSNKHFLKHKDILASKEPNTILILSTSSGIKTDLEALDLKTGGEYLFNLTL